MSPKLHEQLGVSEEETGVRTTSGRRNCIVSGTFRFDNTEVQGAQADCENVREEKKDSCKDPNELK